MFDIIKEIWGQLKTFKINLDTLTAMMAELRKLAVQQLSFQRKLMDLNRHQLGSIDLSDVRVKKVLTAEERKDYVAKVATVFKDIIEPKCKELLIAQEEYMARYTEDEKQLYVGRGTINGLGLVLEEFEDAYKEHIDNIKKQEPFDPHRTLPEV